MDYINIGTGVTTLRTETLVEAVMNLKLSGSDNISSYMAAISRLKSKALSIVASNTTTQNMAKSVGLEVLALLVKAWNRFKTGTGCSHYGRFLELSAGRSLVSYDSSSRNMLVGDRIQGFKVNIKPEKKSKLSSVVLVLKIRGIDQVN
ncbi:hypothetical protein SASPL_101853 [Salvia splendens]|uniref:Uncharacterized protein n=1 Tax=Salvia splendens TaxID=180675 RepID=A0A8X9ACA3_SALSN|nr:hypothetical protein SASPL_101853 [Salvia splendens]